VIGSHTLSFEDAGDGRRVVVDIAIAVKLLGITVYRYTHRNEELWRDGRLVEIRSKTDNDGTPDFVRGRAGDGVLRVEGSKATHDLPVDTPTTNYWNTDLLRRTAWLNSQTGELLKVTVTPKGREEVPVPGGSVLATRHSIVGDLNIELWYGADGDWVKCIFKAQDGSLIEYRRR
jgi:hypothetical protein